MRHLVRAFALSALVVSTGCDEIVPVPSPPPPITIQVSPSILNLEVGQSAHVVASVQNAINPGVNFSSTNTSVATVNQAGLVTCVGPGTAIIIAAAAADPTVRANVAVVCLAPPSPPITIQVSPEAMEMEVGESTPLVVSVQNTSNTGVTFATSDQSVATVTQAGLVTCVGPGTANIMVFSVADPTVQATVTVHCTLPPMAAEVSPAEVALEVGETSTLTCVVRHATTGAVLEDEAVTWSSGNEDVATVSDEGLVTGVAEGEAVITCAVARQPDATATATVTVSPTAGPSCGVSGSTTFVVSVASDPFGHHPYVGMPSSISLAVSVEDSLFTVTGPYPFVSVTGTIDATCAVTATGSGTAAGFSDVRVRLRGPYPDLPPFQWMYEMGEPFGLPEGPIVYRLQRQ